MQFSLQAELSCSHILQLRVSQINHLPCPHRRECHIWVPYIWGDGFAHRQSGLWCAASSSHCRSRARSPCWLCLTWECHKSRYYRWSRHLQGATNLRKPEMPSFCSRISDGPMIGIHAIANIHVIYLRHLARGFSIISTSRASFVLWRRFFSWRLIWGFLNQLASD